MKIAVFDIDDTVLKYQPDILESEVITSGKQKAVDLAEEGYAIAYVSARTEAERDDVIRKLKTENFPCDESMVYLIPDFNMNIPRFKKKSLEELQTKGDIEYFFDDTKINRSVAEKLGIPNVEEIEIMRTDMDMKEYSKYLDRLKTDIKEGVRRNLRVRKVSEKKEEKTSTTGLEMFPEQFYDSLAKSGAIKDDSIEIGLVSIDSIEFVENKITDVVTRSGSTDPITRKHPNAYYGSSVGQYAGDGAHRPASLGDYGSTAESSNAFEPAYNLTRNIDSWENPSLPYWRYKSQRSRNFSRISGPLGRGGQRRSVESSMNAILNSTWIGGTTMNAQDPPPFKELEPQEIQDIFGFKTYKYNFTTPLIYEWTQGRENRYQYQVPNHAMQYPLPIYDVGNKNDAGMERSAQAGFWNDWWQNEVGDKAVYDADGDWEKIEMNDIYWSNKTAKNMVLEMEILSEDKKTRYILEVVIVRNGDYAVPIPLIYFNKHGRRHSMKARQIKGTETETITFLPGQNASKLMADMDAKDGPGYYQESDERSSNFAVSSEERASWSGGILFHARKVDEPVESDEIPDITWEKGKELKPAEWKYIFGKLREKGFVFPLANQLDTWMNATANRKTYGWLVFTTSVLPMLKRSNSQSHNSYTEYSGFLYFTASKQERDKNKGLGFDIGDGRMIFWIEPTDTTVKDDLDATIAVAEKWMPESSKEGDYDYYKEKVKGIGEDLFTGESKSILKERDPAGRGIGRVLEYIADFLGKNSDDIDIEDIRNLDIQAFAKHEDEDGYGGDGYIELQDMVFNIGMDQNLAAFNAMKTLDKDKFYSQFGPYMKEVYETALVERAIKKKYKELGQKQEELLQDKIREVQKQIKNIQDKKSRDYLISRKDDLVKAAEDISPELGLHEKGKLDFEISDEVQIARGGEIIAYEEDEDEDDSDY